jgi:hypothetical protein
VGLALSLLEAPLRIQVLASQINSGAWVRNGYGLMQAASIYATQVRVRRCPSPRYGPTLSVHLWQVEAEGLLNADVAMLQVVATLLRYGLPEPTTDMLVPILLHRFALSRYFDWASTAQQGDGSDRLEGKHKQGLAEDFLRLAINLINDRTIVGPPLPPAADKSWKDEHHRVHMEDFIIR